KSWDDVGVWEVDFEVLRKQMLGDDNEKTYTIFHDFKRYVLEPSLREIHALGWLVSYVVLKEGKKYLGDDESKLAKLMKVTHPLLRDFEAGNKVFENLGGATLNQLKTEFPGLYQTLK
nr:hypothetical protein [Tanacetum cinerariifolium]